MAKYTAIFAILLSCIVVSGCEVRKKNPEVAGAVALNDAEKVAAYLADGGDPNITSADGKPLIYLAAGPRGGMEVLQLLINAGASLDAVSAEGRTVLQNAASWCDVDVIDALLRAGADRDQAGANGLRPLDVVCKSPQDRRAASLNLLMR